MNVKVNGKFVDIDLPNPLLLAKKVAIEGVPQDFFLLFMFILLVDSVHTKTSNGLNLSQQSLHVVIGKDWGKSHSNIS